MQVQLEYGTVGFQDGGGTGVPGENPRSNSRISNKLNPHMTPGLNQTRTTLVGCERLTTMPSLLPSTQMAITSNRSAHCLKAFADFFEEFESSLYQ